LLCNKCLHTYVVACNGIFTCKQVHGRLPWLILCSYVSTYLCKCTIKVNKLDHKFKNQAGIDLCYKSNEIAKKNILTCMRYFTNPIINFYKISHSKTFFCFLTFCAKQRSIPTQFLKFTIIVIIVIVVLEDLWWKWKFSLWKFCDIRLWWLCMLILCAWICIYI